MFRETWQFFRSALHIVFLFFYRIFTLLWKNRRKIPPVFLSFDLFNLFLFQIQSVPDVVNTESTDTNQRILCLQQKIFLLESDDHAATTQTVHPPNLHLERI